MELRCYESTDPVKTLQAICREILSRNEGSKSHHTDSSSSSSRSGTFRSSKIRYRYRMILSVPLTTQQIFDLLFLVQPWERRRK